LILYQVLLYINNGRAMAFVRIFDLTKTFTFKITFNTNQIFYITNRLYFIF